MDRVKEIASSVVLSVMMFLAVLCLAAIAWGVLAGGDTGASSLNEQKSGNCPTLSQREQAQARYDQMVWGYDGSGC